MTVLLLIFSALMSVKFSKLVEKSTNNRVNLSRSYGIIETTHSKDIPKLRLSPSIKNVFINIGSNLDPIMPDEELGPCAHTIAVEPIVAHRIDPHPQLSVIPAAVADRPGVMSMMKLNRDGVSSSLATVSSIEEAPSHILKGIENVIVPVITLSSLLSSIPSTAEISVMMTDIQGLDFTAIKEGAEILKEKVTHLKTEVWKEDKYTYDDTKNDLCRDWIPFMEELGMGHSRPFIIHLTFEQVTLIFFLSQIHSFLQRLHSSQD